MALWPEITELAQLLAGTDFVINAAGEFFYSGPPAAGNLVVSLARAAGKDPYGNAYLAGIVSYNSTVSTSVAVQHNSNGLFFYTGPANGTGPWTLTLNQFYLGPSLQVTGTTAGFQNFLIGNGSGNFQYVFPSGDATGVTDRTNINSALSVNNKIVLLSGAYLVDRPVAASTNGCQLRGFGPPGDKNLTDTATSIRLVSGSNSDVVQISARDVVISGIELDGNKAGQTGGTGAVVNFLVPGSATDTCVIENCYIHDGFNHGILVKGSTSGHKIRGCSILNNAANGVLIDNASTDITIQGCGIGSSGIDNIYTQGFVVHIDTCDIFSAGQDNIQADWAGAGTMITNCGIDRAQRRGIFITARMVEVVGCTIHSNSQAGNGLWPSIGVDDTAHAGLLGNPAITSCGFWLDGGIVNLPNWHIQYVNTAKAKTHGNDFQAASSTLGTISAASAAKDANETG